MKMRPGFNARKAAQVVAFFAMREGGMINILKVTKLTYLADRAFMEKYDRPILNDSLVSMDHGPVNSITLNLMNGLMGDVPEWNEFVSDRAGYNVGIRNKNLKAKALDELNKAEVEVLETLWKKFGKMSPYQVRDYTHRHCPEWENPNGSSAPIPYSRVLQYLKKKNATDIEERILDEHRLDRVFAQLA